MEKSRKRKGICTPAMYYLSSLRFLLFLFVIIISLSFSFLSFFFLYSVINIFLHNANFPLFTAGWERNSRRSRGKILLFGYFFFFFANIFLFIFLGKWRIWLHNASSSHICDSRTWPCRFVGATTVPSIHAKIKFKWKIWVPFFQWLGCWSCSRCWLYLLYIFFSL